MSLVAGVERKSLPDLIASLTSGRLRCALGELAARAEPRKAIRQPPIWPAKFDDLSDRYAQMIGHCRQLLYRVEKPP